MKYHVIYKCHIHGHVKKEDFVSLKNATDRQIELQKQSATTSTLIIGEDLSSSEGYSKHLEALKSVGLDENSIIKDGTTFKVFANAEEEDEAFDAAMMKSMDDDEVDAILDTEAEVAEDSANLDMDRVDALSEEQLDEALDDSEDEKEGYEEDYGYGWGYEETSDLDEEEDEE